MRVFVGYFRSEVTVRAALAAFLVVSAAAAMPGATEFVDNPEPPPTPTAPTITPTIAPSPVTEVDRTLDEITRQERDLKRENEGLGRDSELAKARTIARARA